MNAIPAILENTEYLHYKGGAYTVLSVALDATNAADDRKVVVYRSHEDNRLYVRALEEFVELVLWENGEMRPRFIPASAL